MCGWKNGSGVVRNTQKTEFLGFPKFFDVFSQKNWVRHGQEQIQKNLKKKFEFFFENFKLKICDINPLSYFRKKLPKQRKNH